MAPRRGVGDVHTHILKSMKAVYIIFLLNQHVNLALHEPLVDSRRSHEKGLNNPVRNIRLRSHQGGINSGVGTHGEKERLSDAYRASYFSVRTGHDQTIESYSQVCEDEVPAEILLHLLFL